MTTVPPNQRITYEQAEHLATLITAHRPDWHTPGIIKTLEKHAPNHTALNLTQALITAAQNPNNRTPAVLNHPGPHWNHTTEEPTTHTPQPCPIPEHRTIGRLATNCPECRKFNDFPTTISRKVIQQLAPDIQDKISRQPGITFTD